MPTFALQPGEPYKPFDDDSAAAPVQSAKLAMPAMVRKTLTWQTVFASAPSACSITLEESNDGSNWTTLDTSTATGGEVRTVETGAAFVRANKASQTGGGNLTLTILLSRN